MTKLYLTMPQPGETITEGTIVQWLVKEGDQVTEGTPIAEMETDKAVFEHECPFEGQILQIIEADQSRVAVAKPIAIIEVPKEKADHYMMLGIAESVDGDVETVASTESAPVQETAPVENTQETAAFTPQNIEDLSHIKMAPYVRRVAFQSGLDGDILKQLAAAHPEARVTKDAIENYLQDKNIPAPTAARSENIATNIGGAGDYTVQPYSPIRVRIAENMALSKAKIPHAHTGISVDVSKLVEFRKANKDKYKAKHGQNLNFLTLMYPAFVTAIKKYPAVNSSFVENGDSPEIRLFNNINLGVAVGSEAGLIIPVVKKVETLNSKDFNASLNDKIKRGMEKKLMPDDYSGTTIIFNNFGFFGLNMGVQIIQYPLAATLGMGAIEKKVVPTSTGEGNAIMIRDYANFFLAFDHRIIDGLEAGQFLSTLKEELEKMTFEHISL